MLKKNEFEKIIEKEIINLIDAPIESKNLQVFSSKKYEENKEVKIYQTTFGSIIITAPSLYDITCTIINSYRKDKRVSLSLLRDLLQLSNHKIESKTVFLFLNPDNYIEPVLDPKYKIFKIGEKYKNEFEEFVSDCSRKDLEEGQVSLDDPVVFGCFNENKLVGFTSYWFWGDSIADIGVIIHPKYREKGLAKVLVSKLCKWGISNNKINLYRHDEMNSNSKYLALSLNFKEYLYVENMKLQSL